MHVVGLPCRCGGDFQVSDDQEKLWVTPFDKTPETIRVLLCSSPYADRSDRRMRPNLEDGVV